MQAGLVVIADAEIQITIHYDQHDKVFGSNIVSSGLLQMLFRQYLNCKPSILKIMTVKDKISSQASCEKIMSLWRPLWPFRSAFILDYYYFICTFKSKPELSNCILQMFYLKKPPTDYPLSCLNMSNDKCTLSIQHNTVAEFAIFTSEMHL